jgi:hypothetical protein
MLGKGGALSLGTLAGEQGRDHGINGRQGGALVGRNRPDQLWHSVSTLDGHEAREPLDHGVVGGKVAIGSVGSEAGDLHVEQPRVVARELFVA